MSNHDPQSSTNETLSLSRRKSIRRRVTVESDEDEKAMDDSDRPQAEDADSLDFIDIEDPRDTALSPPTRAGRSGGLKRGKVTQIKGAFGDGPLAKKRRVQESEDGSDEEYGADHAEDVTRSSAEESEGDFASEERDRRQPATKLTPNDSKATKTRSLRHKKESTQRLRATQRSKGDDAVDSTSAGTRSPSQPKEPTPPPKKKKLPTIKKNRPPNTAAPTTTTTTSTAVKPQPNTDAIPSITEPPKATGRVIAANQGVADFDLRNASVYAELFKSTGGATTLRSGLSRREKEEERRRELNKMRDEARAKRLADAPPPFDLAAQADKVARIEQKLKDNRSNAAWPNCLAAKWRQLWEREKEYTRRQHQRKDQQPGWDDVAGREEGEMNDTLNHL